MSPCIKCGCRYDHRRYTICPMCYTPAVWNDDQRMFVYDDTPSWDEQQESAKLNRELNRR